MSKNKEKPTKIRDYATLHDRAVRSYKRSSRVLYWAAGLNAFGIIFVALFVGLMQQNAAFPTRFLLLGASNFTMWGFGFISQSPEMLWLIVLLSILSGLIFSFLLVFMNAMSKRPPNQRWNLANLIVYAFDTVLLIVFYLILMQIPNSPSYSTLLQELLLSLAVHLMILYFLIDTMLQFHRVLALEKEFAGQNVTISETRIVQPDELNPSQKEEEKDYDFLKK